MYACVDLLSSPGASSCPDQPSLTTLGDTRTEGQQQFHHVGVPTVMTYMATGGSQPAT